MVTRSKLVKRAEEEELLRRRATFVELSALSDLLVTQVDSANIDTQELKLQSLANLNFNIGVLSQLYTALQSTKEANFALLENHFSIISHAQTFLSQYFEVIINTNIIRTCYNFTRPIVFGSHSECEIQGTVIPNLLQVSIFSVLDTLLGGPEQVFHLLHKRGAYNFAISPVVQTITLPKSEEIRSVPNLSKSSYIFNENGALQLLLLTLGYGLGGSRFSPIYQNKALAIRDCSSALAKWLGASVPFYTHHIYEVYSGHIDGSIYAHLNQLPHGVTNAICRQAVNSFLVPLYGIDGIKDLKIGYVFLEQYEKGHGGHTGVVTQISVLHNSFTVLSYSRRFGDFAANSIAGLGYREYQLDVNQHMFLMPKESFLEKASRCIKSTLGIA